MSDFIAVNTARLRTSYFKLSRFLESRSIRYIPAVAGLFVFARLCDEGSEEAEKDMLAHLSQNRVCLVPGDACHCSEPGWFRITFALKESELQEGISRMGLAMDEYRNAR